MKISNKSGEQISPNMFGLFFEDINFAADGGLYAELIENRSFEAREAFGNPGNFYAMEDLGYAWSPVSASAALPDMRYVTGTAISEANPHYLRFTATEAGQGFANKAYDGIYARKGQIINVKFYARAVRYDGGFTVSIQKDGRTFAEAQVGCTCAIPFAPFTDLTVDFKPDIKEFAEELDRINNLDKCCMAPASDWVCYETSLTLGEDAEGAQFVITVNKPGVLDFDFISAIPADAVAGIFRRDLFEALDAMHPGFIRFPGGCIVEGISLENRYRWKNTVGNNIDRKYIPNLWAFDDDRTKDINTQRPDSHYGQSYGLGFYEYFLLCELLGAKALPVLSMGIACQFRSTQLTDIDSQEFQSYVDDALDLIEFANGDTTTRWGALRKEMGHEKPFNLEMLAIGNEQWETNADQLFERNDRFEAAIHSKYPEMKLLGTAGPAVDLPTTGIAWDYYRAGLKQNKNFCYAVDEHYYKSPQWMYDNIGLYDNYPRDLAVFAGEYAAHTASRSNNMESAISEAAFMTGLEKNAGVVKLASYAPLFNRVGHSQWTPDMIWFNSNKVFLTPNYYVQKLFANNVGQVTLEATEEIEALRKEGIYVSLSKASDGKTILKAVNTTDKAFELKLEGTCAKASMSTLHAAGEEIQGMPQPSEIVEQGIELAGAVELEAMSFSVLRF